jgi:hypothetical protein
VTGTASSSISIVVHRDTLPLVYEIAERVFGLAVCVDADDFLREIDRQARDTLNHRYFEWRVLCKVGFGGKARAERLSRNYYRVWFDCYPEDATDATRDLFKRASRLLEPLALACDVQSCPIHSRLFA